MHTTGRTFSECSCPKCQQQCTTPCLGTPQDMYNLIKAGYGPRLAPTKWLVGMMIGTINRPVELIAPLFDEKKKSCTFFTDGRCELHSKGLKPTEGKLSHHTHGQDCVSPAKSITWNVAKTWLNLNL